MNRFTTDLIFHPLAGILLAIYLLSGCSAAVQEDPITVEEIPGKLAFKKASFSAALDCSSYPEIARTGGFYLDKNGQEMLLPDILSTAGIPAVRLRLWVNPQTGQSSLSEVKSFASQLRQKGIKIWLSIHYSDTWADPGNQQTPAAWQDLTFEVLRDSMAAYTSRVAREVPAEVIQIGNEINDGLLHPQGQLSRYPEQTLALLEAGIEAVREYAPDAAIMIHYAGIAGTVDFFNRLSNLSYDLMGLSYYPIWHGRSIVALEGVIAALTKGEERELWIAETAYPFTLDWNDWTNNIVGLENQLVLPDFPANPQGQRAFLKRLQEIMDKYPGAKGICYWGAELTAWKGPEAMDGSPWENQALFDFNFRALPALDLFSGE